MYVKIDNQRQLWLLAALALDGDAVEALVGEGVADLLDVLQLLLQSHDIAPVRVNLFPLLRLLFRQRLKIPE